MRRTVIALAAVIAGVVPAAASGGLWCDAKDASITFAASTGVTRGTGAFFQLKGTLDVAIAGIPDDLRNLTLDGMLIHSWLDEDEAKLQFYFERQDGEFASIDFTVETEMVEEGEYRGEYLLTVFESRPAEPEPGQWSAKGPVSCGAE
jgi:hypothetical protein